MTGNVKDNKKEEGVPEEPLLDSRGWPLIRLTKVFPCMSNSDIAARAHFFAGLRALSEADYMAGKGMTVETIVRATVRRTWATASAANPARRGAMPKWKRSS